MYQVVYIYIHRTVQVPGYALELTLFRAAGSSATPLRSRGVGPGKVSGRGGEGSARVSNERSAVGGVGSPRWPLSEVKLRDF